MMATTTLSHPKATSYAFLSQPPPQKWAAQALPPLPLPSSQQTPRSKSSTFVATISAWAAHVQPGSPVPPTPSSPLHRRGSIGARRAPNLGHTVGAPRIPHGRVVSSPLVLSTPTTASHKTFDFTAVGYTSIFRNLPETPATPSPLLREKAMRDQAIIETKILEKERAKELSKERKEKVLKRIKSLTNLKPRGKVDAAPNFLAAVTTTAKVIQRKRSIYGPPPPLQSELALMQFANGGKLDNHIQRAMTGANGVVGDVYRDGKGGVWLDSEEELEYRGLLLASEASSRVDGSEFGGNALRSSEDSQSTLVNAPMVVDSAQKRRKFPSTISSQDSDLDPVYLIKVEQSPKYNNDRVLDFDLRDRTNTAPSLKANNARSKRNGVLLTLPARPSRAERHLRKPEMLNDISSFTGIPKSPLTPTTPLTPSIFTNSTNLFATMSTDAKPRKKTRQRPALAPLKISPAMQKLRRVIAVSSPGLPATALPPLAPLPPVPASAKSQPPATSRGSRSAARHRTPRHERVLSGPASPNITLITDTRERSLVVEGRREFMMDTFAPEPVSRIDRDSETDFIRWERAYDAAHPGNTVPPVQPAYSVPGLKARKSPKLELKGIFGMKRI